ncbi:hypothetical protein [Cellulomonas hominis]
MVGDGGTVPVEDMDGVLEVEASDAALAVSIDTNDAASARITMDGTATTLAAADAVGGGEVIDGLVQYENGDGASTTVAQPVDNGVRFLTIVEASSAPTRYTFAFDGGAELTPTFFEDGSVVLHDPAGEHRGYVQAPWAVDADGNDVATHYEWSDGALIQVVEHDKPGVAHPVIADPTWTYAFDQVGVGAAGYAEPGITYTMAITELKRCFNCSFPIAGAPKTYPSAGQNINLNASPFTLITVPAPVTVATSGSRGFMFRALAGHFDGAGSTIDFKFYNSCVGSISYLRLLVDASVVTDRGSVANAANAAVAKTQWSAFVNRTAQNTGANQGYGGRC